MTALEYRLRLLKKTLMRMNLMQYVVEKDVGTSVDYDGLQHDCRLSAESALVGAYVALIDIKEQGYD